MARPRTQADGSGLLDLGWWQRRMVAAAWRQRLTRPQDEAIVRKVRLWTSRGRPLGSDRFVAKLERLLGRRLRPLPVGRPRKKPHARRKK